MNSAKTGNRLTLTLLALSTLTIMVGAAITPSLPKISANLNMTDYASLLITVPSLGVVLAAPFVSVLLSKFGSKLTVLYGLILYGMLGVTGAFITYTPLMMIDRFILGGATAMVMAGGTSLIAELYTGDARLKMISRQGMAIELGGVIFLSIGGGLALFHWKSPFALYAIAWLVFLAVWVYVPNNIERAESRDEKGLNKANSMRDIYLIAISSMLIFFAAFVNLPHLLHGQGYSELQTGLYLAMISLVAVIFAGVMPKLRRQMKAKSIFAIAFLSYAIAHTVLAIWTEAPALLIAALCLGIGFGFTVPLTNYELIERSNPETRKRNLAYLSSAIFLGQFLSSALDIFPQLHVSAFQVAAILSLLSCALLFIHSNNRSYWPSQKMA